MGECRTEEKQTEFSQVKLANFETPLAGTQAALRLEKRTTNISESEPLYQTAMRLFEAVDTSNTLVWKKKNVVCCCDKAEEEGRIRGLASNATFK